MVQIKIIRHSERLDYAYPFYWLICFGHYWSDSPLTTKGYQVANDKGKIIVSDNFKPACIYTSPYSRTMATAAEIKASFPYSEIVIEPLLSEYQPSYKHRINLYPNGIPTTHDGKETIFSYPETHEDFSKRALFIVSKLIDKKMDLIIITHGELLKVYIKHLQSLFLDVMQKVDTIPYLTVLSFEYNTETNEIVKSSIRIE